MARRKAVTDTNSAIVGLLRDLAAVQTSKESKWGYARAADAIAALPAPIESFLRPDGTLRKIDRIGPSSTRVILEVLQTGASATVARAQADSGQGREVEKRGGVRDTFLSRAEVLAALKNRRLRGLSLADYRGDLQMHSTYSDGSQTLEVIVDTGIARGYEYAAVTDHSYGLPIARGVSMARLAEQHRHIDRLNETYAGRFRLIKGIEANILADGTVDMTPAERRRLEIVVAAPHSALRSSADQTRRISTSWFTQLRSGRRYSLKLVPPARDLKPGAWSPKPGADLGVRLPCREDAGGNDCGRRAHGNETERPPRLAEDAIRGSRSGRRAPGRAPLRWRAPTGCRFDRPTGSGSG